MVRLISFRRWPVLEARRPKVPSSSQVPLFHPAQENVVSSTLVDCSVAPAIFPSLEFISLIHDTRAASAAMAGKDRLRLHISSSASLCQAVMGLWLAQVTLIFGAIFHFPSPPSHPTLDTPRISGLCLSHPSWIRATQRTGSGSGGGCVYPVCASAGGTD